MQSTKTSEKNFLTKRKTTLEIGLKSSLNKTQLQNKIVKGLKVLELHLYENDFYNFEKIKKQLLEIHKKHPKLKIMLHAPVMLKQKEYLSLSENNVLLFSKIYTVCKELEFVKGFVLHSAYKNQEEEKSLKTLKSLRKTYKDIDKYMYVENQTQNFSVDTEKWFSFLVKGKVKKICFDVCHFTKNHTQEEMFKYITRLEKKFKIYFHVSDNLCGKENEIPKNLGKGNIDLKRLKKLVSFGIIETFPKDENIGKEVKDDYFYFLNL